MEIILMQCNQLIIFWGCSVSHKFSKCWDIKMGFPYCNELVIFILWIPKSSLRAHINGNIGYSSHETYSTMWRNLGCFINFSYNSHVYYEGCFLRNVNHKGTVGKMQVLGKLGKMSYFQKKNAVHCNILLSSATTAPPYLFDT